MRDGMTHIADAIRALAAEHRGRAAACAADGAQVSGERVHTRIAEALEEIVGRKGTATPSLPPNLALVAPSASWRERLWTVPDETRLGVRELAEALGRPRSWVYRHTSKRSGLPLLPHRRLDGDLVFLASEIREWVASHEDVIVKALPPVISFRKGA